MLFKAYRGFPVGTFKSNCYRNFSTIPLPLLFSEYRIVLPISGPQYTLQGETLVTDLAGMLASVAAGHRLTVAKSAHAYARVHTHPEQNCTLGDSQYSDVCQKDRSMINALFSFRCTVISAYSCLQHPR